MSSIAISVQNISKTFKIPKEKINILDGFLFDKITFYVRIITPKIPAPIF